jgi:hypothetical protein
METVVAPDCCTTGAEYADDFTKDLVTEREDKVEDLYTPQYNVPPAVVDSTMDVIVKFVRPVDTDIDATVGTVSTSSSRYVNNRATACFVIFTSPVAQLVCTGNKIVPFNGALHEVTLSSLSQPTHKSPERAANSTPPHIEWVYDVSVVDVTASITGSLAELSEQFIASSVNTS